MRIDNNIQPGTLFFEKGDVPALDMVWWRWQCACGDRHTHLPEYTREFNPMVRLPCQPGRLCQLKANYIVHRLESGREVYYRPGLFTGARSLPPWLGARIWCHRGAAVAARRMPR